MQNKGIRHIFGRREPNLKIGKDHELASYIEQTIIDKDCSPAAVYGYALEKGRTFKTHISVPTIYSYLKKGVFLNLTQKALPDMECIRATIKR